MDKLDEIIDSIEDAVDKTNEVDKLKMIAYDLITLLREIKQMIKDAGDSAKSEVDVK